MRILNSKPDCKAWDPPNSKSAWPVRRMVIMAGFSSLIFLSMVAPSIRGIRMSETTTSKVLSCRISFNASSALVDKVKSKVLPKFSFIPLRIGSSSSTIRILFIIIMNHINFMNASFRHNSFEAIFNLFDIH